MLVGNDLFWADQTLRIILSQSTFLHQTRTRHENRSISQGENLILGNKSYIYNHPYMRKKETNSGNKIHNADPSSIAYSGKNTQCAELYQFVYVSVLWIFYTEIAIGDAPKNWHISCYFIKKTYIFARRGFSLITYN